MKYFAVVNRAAGGGRCGKLADSALEKIRRGGVEVELAESRCPGHGSELTYCPQRCRLLFRSCN